MAASVMRKVSTRSLVQHKVRLILTVFSVVLGTSFVAAAVVFTSTVSEAFNGIFDNAAKGVSVQVSGAKDDSAGVPTALADDLDAHAGDLGIARLAKDYSGSVTVADSSGRAIQTGGAPSIGMAYLPPDRAVGEQMTIEEGRAPQRSGEIALNADAAEKADLRVGSTTKVVVGAGTEPPMTVTVVGITDMPTSTGGFVGVTFDEQTAARLFSDGEYVSTVNLAAAPGVSDDELRDAVASFLTTRDASAPTAYSVRTGDEVRADQKEAIGEFLTIFQAILLAFAAIGLLVGTFIIYNTFSMIVAQRNRELALLRAIGAGRSDISRSVMREALIVGVVGGVIGLGLGIGIAAAMLAFTESQGLPSNGVQVGVAAVVSALLVGVVVTLLSAWIPARRASRIPPVEAMRQSSVEPGAGSLRGRTLVGAVIGVLAVAALVVGGLGEGVGPAVTVGLGALLAVIAVVVGAPAVARPVVGGLGAVFQRPFGTVGRLARTNAVRNPRRSAATAFALTLGLMLVVVIGTLGWSFKGTVNAAVDKGLQADFVVTGTNNMPLSPAVADAVRTVPGTSAVVAQAYSRAGVDGSTTFVSSPMGGSIDDVVALDMEAGTADLSGHDLLVADDVARDKGWTLGDSVDLEGTTGQDVTVRVTGVFAPNQLVVPVMVGADAYDELVPVAAQRIVGPILVKAAAGTSLDELRGRLTDATAPYLTAQVQDRNQFKNSISSQIDQMMATLGALLALSLVIAVLGIINTLALSVVERRQEIGMLRAVGMSRAQVRRTVYLESTYIAVFGALLGTVLGLAIGVPLVRTLAHWGIDGVVIPWPLIGATLVGSAVVGVVAALWPAVTAARTRPLEAITAE